MNKADLVGKTVSVTFQGLNRIESYIGIIKTFDNEYMVLEFPGDKRYSSLIIRSQDVTTILVKTREYTEANPNRSD